MPVGRRTVGRLPRPRFLRRGPFHGEARAVRSTWPTRRRRRRCPALAHVPAARRRPVSSAPLLAGAARRRSRRRGAGCLARAALGRGHGTGRGLRWGLGEAWEVEDAGSGRAGAVAALLLLPRRSSASIGLRRVDVSAAHARHLALPPSCAAAFLVELLEVRLAGAWRPRPGLAKLNSTSADSMVLMPAGAEISSGRDGHDARAPGSHRHCADHVYLQRS